MNYDHILSAFYAEAWAILPAKLDEIRAFLSRKAAGEPMPEFHAAARPGVQMAGRVAILPVFGVISQRAGMLEKASGGVSAEELGATLDNLVSDKAVKAVVMAFDSPGGSVAGIPELAAKIRAARDQKKVVGLADSMAASAGYWLMSQCSETNVCPSGQVGSVGVIASHFDSSKAKEMMGMKTTVVTSAPFKGELNPDMPLSEEAHAELQAKVNAYHSMFIADIARGRGVSEAKVEASYGKGRMLLAKDAKAAGMVDHIATLAQVVGRLGGGGVASGSLAAYRARAAELEE